MSQQVINRQFEHSDEQMFDLLVDIENYPLFIPLWEMVEILDKQENGYRNRQIVQFFTFRQRFTMLTTYERPRWIRSVMEEEICNAFEYSWKITLLTSTTCDVKLSIELDFSSRVLKGLFEDSYDTLLNGLFNAFETEGQERYAEVSAG